MVGMRQSGKSVFRPEFQIIKNVSVETEARLRWFPDKHLGRQGTENIETIPQGILWWEVEVSYGK